MIAEQLCSHNVVETNRAACHTRVRFQELERTAAESIEIRHLNIGHSATCNIRHVFLMTHAVGNQCFESSLSL